MTLEQHIRTVADYPKKGVQFRDLTPLLGDGQTFSATIETLRARYQPLRLNRVAAIEARGFIVGAPLACALGVGFIPIRKKGKLPFTTLSCEDQLEYGMDAMEMHTDALRAGDRVLLVDDVLATGGTAKAAARLIKKAGGQLVEIAFLLNLADLGGAAQLTTLGYPFYCLHTLSDPG
ncbi:MAG: adenine phosphoribosyltransferase [Burkholderiaceae bacterium]|jgi:adenine phosphoribosyltransferase|nr:adenine phosphoribosyltransferase [Burkholderiaceae bacterium]